MKIETILLISGGGVLAYLLYKRTQTAAANQTAANQTAANQGGFLSILGGLLGNAGNDATQVQSGASGLVNDWDSLTNYFSGDS